VRQSLRVFACLGGSMLALVVICNVGEQGSSAPSKLPLGGGRQRLHTRLVHWEHGASRNLPLSG
jgi:hypothetical protein